MPEPIFPAGRGGWTISCQIRRTTIYRTPKAEYLLQKFEYIVSGEMRLPDGDAYGFVSELTDLQKYILEILEVPDECYSYEYLFDTS
jgi:hypothetical protein